MKKKVFRERYMIPKQDEINSIEEIVKEKSKIIMKRVISNKTIVNQKNKKKSDK